MNGPLLLKAGLIAALVGALYALSLIEKPGESFGPTQLELWLSGAGSLAPLLYVGAMAAVVVVSPLPSLPLDVAGGAFFGPALGTLYSVAGGVLGAVLSFGLARWLGRGLVERFLGGHISFCSACSDRLLTRIVLCSRLLPFVSFDLVSYGAGLTKLSLGRFALATGLGMLPLTFLYNYFGSRLAFGQGSTLALGALLVAGLLLLPSWIEKHDLFSLRQRFTHGDDAPREPAVG